MRVKIFIVLLLCALQQVYGSKSTKKKSGTRLKKWVEYSLIALAANYGANEIFDAGHSHVAELNTLACKYNVPDRNAEVMMNFVICAENQKFEKYMFDNSENCPMINEIYKQTENDGKCAFKTPKNIFDGTLTRLRGEQVSHAANVEMLKTYLLSYAGEYGALFKSQEFVPDFLRESDPFPKKDFDFFQFKSMLELARFVFPDDTKKAAEYALRSEFKNANVENVKRLLELTKLAFPDDMQTAVLFALANDYKGANAENAKRMMELTKLASPDKTSSAVLMALSWSREYINVNVENAKRVLQLMSFAFPDARKEAGILGHKHLDNVYKKKVNTDKEKKMADLALPSDPGMAVTLREVLKPKYNDFDVEKVNKKYQELKSSWSWYLSSEQRIMREALEVTYPKIIKEDF